MQPSSSQSSWHVSFVMPSCTLPLYGAFLSISYLLISKWPLSISFDFQQEAEKVLSKRLGEVTEELKKSEDRESKVSKALEEQKKKCQTLNDQLNKIESNKANESDSMNALTSKLTEANSRVSELEKMFTSVETQLKESQEIQSHKDKEIQVYHMTRQSALARKQVYFQE